MAKLEYFGIDEYINDIRSALSESGVLAMSKEAVYEGQRVAADKIRSTIESWPTQKDAKNGMTKTEKKALLSGLGTSSIKYDGQDVAGKIGFAGYGSHPTQTWPKGVPIPLTARSLIHGTSWRKKDDFMKKAVSGLSSEVEKAMEEKIDQRLKQIADDKNI